MTKSDLRNIFDLEHVQENLDQQIDILERYFEFVVGQECNIYKGNWNTSRLDDIIYIADLSLCDCDVFERIYTKQDFINVAKGHENIAESIFYYVDWQCPDLNDWLSGYEEEEFKEQWGFELSELDKIVEFIMKE